MAFGFCTGAGLTEEGIFTLRYRKIKWIHVVSFRTIPSLF